MSWEILWRHTGRGVIFVALCGLTFVVCFPLVWALSTSLKPKSEIFATPPTLVPKAPTFENYAALVTGRPQYFQSGGSRSTRAPPRPSSLRAGSSTASSSRSARP